MHKSFIFFVLFLFPAMTLAGDISLSVDNTFPEIGQVFTLEMQVEFDSLEPIKDVTIPGLEQFEVFSQMQSEQTQILGEQIQKTTSVKLQLKPTDFGTYELGPASGTFSGETLESNSILIKVGQGSPVGEEVTVSKKTSSGSIEGLQEPKYSLPLLPILFTIFVAIFYYLMYILFLSKPKPVTELPHNQISYIPTIKTKLRQLQKRIPDIEKPEFYQKLHTIIRKYIGQKYELKDIQNMTLREIRPYLKNDSVLLELFSDSYRREFDEKTDTKKTRDSIVNDYLNHI